MCLSYNYLFTPFFVILLRYLKGFMRSIKDHLDELKGQLVLIRCNFDVPLEKGVVGDTTRIEAALPTLNLLRSNHCSLVLLAHAGRPNGQYLAQASLAPIVPILSQHLNEPVGLIPYQKDFHALKLSNTPVQLMDNLRFYPQEEANDPEFARHLATLGHAYVNEAFANCHRPHASMVTLPQLMPNSAYAGLELATELQALTKATQDPARPLVVIIGGAKLETKEPLVQAFAAKADTILVGGKLVADLRLKADLPSNVRLAELTSDGKDITPASAQTFARLIHEAKTVIWNGTLGLFEDPLNRQGTSIVAQAVNQTSAYTLVGGGDTETALTMLNLESGIDHISTGGGAMLTYLSEGHLVAVDALNYEP